MESNNWFYSAIVIIAAVLLTTTCVLFNIYVQGCCCYSRRRKIYYRFPEDEVVNTGKAKSKKYEIDRDPASPIELVETTDRRTGPTLSPIMMSSKVTAEMTIDEPRTPDIYVSHTDKKLKENKDDL